MKLQEWQAIIAAYGVLLILSETSMAPLAALMAWGIAVGYLVDVTQTQGNLISNLFSATPSGQTTPTQNPEVTVQSNAANSQG